MKKNNQRHNEDINQLNIESKKMLILRLLPSAEDGCELMRRCITISIFNIIPNLTKLKANRSNERSSSVYPNIYTSNIMKNSREKLSKVFKRVKKTASKATKVDSNSFALPQINTTISEMLKVNDISKNKKQKLLESINQTLDSSRQLPQVADQKAADKTSLNKNDSLNMVSHKVNIKTENNFPVEQIRLPTESSVSSQTYKKITKPRIESSITESILDDEQDTLMLLTESNSIEDNKNQDYIGEKTRKNNEIIERIFHTNYDNNNSLKVNKNHGMYKLQSKQSKRQDGEDTQQSKESNFSTKLK